MDESRSDRTDEATERRRHRRHRLPTGYAAVRVRRDGGEDWLEGHAYDISPGGVRFELDRPLSADRPFEVRVELPVDGSVQELAGVGRLARRVESDEAPPIRMAAQIECWGNVGAASVEPLLERAAAAE